MYHIYEVLIGNILSFISSGQIPYFLLEGKGFQILFPDSGELLNSKLYARECFTPAAVSLPMR
jgi:hypothetical protein